MSEQPFETLDEQQCQHLLEGLEARIKRAVRP